MEEDRINSQARFIEANWVEIQSNLSVVPEQVEYSSLMGQVVKVGPAVKNLRVGDNVIAMAPPAVTVDIPAEHCYKLDKITPNIETTGAYWALALILVPILHHTPIEFGEQVLVLSSGLLGQMLGDLVWLAGAITCIVFDPKYESPMGDEPIIGHQRDVEWIGDTNYLDIRTPANSIDLLIDISGDPDLLQMNLKRVRDAGRVLVAGKHNPAKSDVNLYPDFHRRSLSLMNYKLPTSLMASEHNCDRQPFGSNQMNKLVEYLFENDRLNPSRWPVTRLVKPTFETIDQVTSLSKNRALFIEW